MNKVILLLCLFSISVFGESPDNLLKNPGFEHGKKPWELREWSSPRGKSEFTIVSSGRTGKSCAKIKWLSGGDNILLKQTVPMTGSRSMVFSFYAKNNMRVSSKADVSCSIITVDKNGKKLQYLNKNFSADLDWNRFIYKFVTHKNTAKITVFLRNRKTTTWYDDVSLTESSNISTIDNIAIWYPQNQIIADIHVNHKEKKVNAILKCEIFSKKNQRKALASKKKAIGSLSNIEVIFDLDKITGGDYFLKTTVLDKHNKKIGQSTLQKFRWPSKKGWEPQYKNKVKVLNNFVSELFSAKDLKVNKAKKIVFVNPREGWLYIKAKSSNPATLSLDDQQSPILSLTQQKLSSYTMRFLTKGEHYITINTANDTEIKNLIINTMPEIILCEYQTRPDAGYRERIWKEMNKLLTVCNVSMESFVRAGKSNGYKEKISKSELERIKKWRNSGRKTIVQIPIPGLTSSISAAETCNYWQSSKGVKEFDGLAIDEFAHEKKKNIVFYENAVKRINNDKRFKGKRLYTYSCAAWNSHKKTMKLRKILLEGNHIFAPELYLREQKTEIQAKKHIAQMFQYLKDWKNSYPDSISHMIITLCSTNLGEQGYYRQDTHANVDFKVYYDMQMNYLANDPAFFNLGGVTSWIARYTNTETLLWMTELYRHYCIEGKKNLLSEEYGFIYKLPYIKNPDFASGLKGWKVETSAKNSIKVKNLPGWGFARGVCNTKPDGDTFVVMDIDPKKTNVVSQKIRNLIPGKLYSAEMYSADYQDIITEKRFKKLNSISLKIDGAEILDNLSYVKKFQSDHTMPILFKSKKRNNGPCLNFHYVVFRALEKTAKVSIIDRPANSISHKIPEQKQVLFNFVQIQPYFTTKNTKQ